VRNEKSDGEKKSPAQTGETFDYDQTLNGLVELLDAARRSAARAVNAVMTATYWEIGRLIVEIEQNGKTRAEYGEELLKRLAKDLTARFGRGFSRQNLQQMRLFYLSQDKICQTASGKFDLREISQHLPLSWSHYVKLLAVKTDEARRFYEAEALRGGWTVRQLDRQINSLFYERALLSKDKAAMLKKGAKPTPADAVAPDEEIRDPFVLEFLDLKDEYSEIELEEAIIKHLENFLLELGADFTFVGRQKRLRIDDEWFRVDLVFYHRRLRCLILIDLKLGNNARRHRANAPLLQLRSDKLDSAGGKPAAWLDSLFIQRRGFGEIRSRRFAEQNPRPRISNASA
jgi:predicted nuclease of restriction endonuclease-like (RecB) superfamily